MDLEHYSEIQRLDQPESFVRHSCCLAGQARRRLCIYSRRLNPLIYARPCFIQAVRSLLVGYAHTRVLVLLVEVDVVARSNHPLVSLAQQLTSKMEIRQRSSDFDADERSFLLVDNHRYVLRERWFDLGAGRAAYRVDTHTRILIDDFTVQWETGLPAPGLRRLAL